MEFETHRCMFPVILFVVCLRTSKSLSMGEFDKCHICIGIFYWFGLNFGINLCYFMIYAIFLWLYLVSACSSFDCRFARVEPNVRRKYRNWDQTKSKGVVKDPISPRRKIQDKTCEPKWSTKRGVRGAKKPRQPEATAASPWWLPRPWWPPSPWDALISGGFLFSCAVVRFVLLFSL